ncbi:MAG TPA: LrgB family protein [Parvibaculum sp.]|uniref:LrgB family protein n=1 Tax=Parvibaculum sp. TaxID=2024848 RepID=UPI002C233E4C|nr:LrgB family protein [Parvibaculum sp.]HMM15033.1 LrgB family protein [Parvibaculum sp.]
MTAQHVWFAGEGMLWLCVTLAAYLGARWVQEKLKGHPAANPVFIAAAPIIALLVFSDVSYADYSRGGAILLWLLGPATVGLAVPLYLNFAEVRSALVPMVVALVIGSSAAVLSAVLIGYAMGADIETIRSLAPKSVTTPIAMGIASEIGGIPALTAAFVIITGGIGAIFGSALFNMVRVRDERARGFAMGIAAHGMGTARAFQVSWRAGTFSGVAMALNGIVTAIVLPLLWIAFAH